MISMRILMMSSKITGVWTLRGKMLLCVNNWLLASLIHDEAGILCIWSTTSLATHSWWKFLSLLIFFKLTEHAFILARLITFLASKVFLTWHVVIEDFKNLFLMDSINPISSSWTFGSCRCSWWYWFCWMLRKLCLWMTLHFVYRYKLRRII